MTPPDPGIYPGVGFEEYRSWDCVNNSSLGPMLKSPKQYRHDLDHPRERTPAMHLGTLLHEGRLEPAALLQHCVVQPSFDDESRAEWEEANPGKKCKSVRATKPYRDRVAAFEEANAGKEIISAGEMERLLGMLSALAQDEAANGLLTGAGETEVSLVWDDPLTGLRCKGRIDKLVRGPNVAVDLKTTQDISQFERSCVKFGYFRQAAFYLDGLHVLTGVPWGFTLIPVESSAPFDAVARPCRLSALIEGREQYRRALRQIRDGRKSGQWPGWEAPDAWGQPWDGRACELTVAGRKVAI